MSGCLSKRSGLHPLFIGSGPLFTDFELLQNDREPFLIIAESKKIGLQSFFNVFELLINGFLSLHFDKLSERINNLNEQM